MPSRVDIDPAQIKEVLPFMVLNDVVPGNTERYRYRLVGTKLVEYYGFNPMEKYFDEVASGVYYDEVMETFRRIRINKKPEFDHLQDIFPYLEHYQRLILPLSEDADVNIIWVTVVGPHELSSKPVTMPSKPIIGELIEDDASTPD